MTCVTCGGTLPPRARRFCSKRCNDRWRCSVRTVPFSCPGCGQTVLLPRKKVGIQRYCTRACATATYNRTHLTGPRNGRWRGGRILSYGFEWKKIKREIRERDGACKSCGKTAEQNGRALDVHHLDPYRFSGSHSPENLIALCRSCHMREVDIGRRGPARFAGPRQLELRPPSRRELRRRRGEQQRLKRRALQQQAAALRALGRSLRQIARVLGVSHQTVANWLSAASLS
jgi:5-methylcytosine-specific restriction endonuclease McrA